MYQIMTVFYQCYESPHNKLPHLQTSVSIPYIVVALQRVAMKSSELADFNQSESSNAFTP